MRLVDATRELFLEATLSLAGLERVHWAKSDSVFRVELREGGIAYLRRTERRPEARFRQGPNKDVAAWLFARALGEPLAPVGLLLRAGSSPLALCAEVIGFRPFGFLRPRADLGRVDPRLLTRACDRLDVWNLLLNNLDATLGNMGLVDERAPMGVDYETAFWPRGLRALESPGYYRRVEGFPAPWRDGAIAIDPELARRLRALELDALLRALGPAGLPRRWVKALLARARYLAALCARFGGTLPLEACTTRAFER